MIVYAEEFDGCEEEDNGWPDFVADVEPGLDLEAPQSEDEVEGEEVPQDFEEAGEASQGFSQGGEAPQTGDEEGHEKFLSFNNGQVTLQDFQQGMGR